MVFIHKQYKNWRSYSQVQYTAVYVKPFDMWFAIKY